MRQALSYAVDKKAIVAAVFKDSGTPANSLLPPGMLGYNDKLPEYAYDPQKARELLKQAGLEQGLRPTSGRCRYSALTTRTRSASPR
ncbi:hypothetical protein AK51_05830 [Serratia nematodiphila DZ0503SBS1]|nr:hypothetical protein AK51_05830 [Serratia nematodiphila DZ0503SBS1]